MNRSKAVAIPKDQRQPEHYEYTSEHCGRHPFDTKKHPRGGSTIAFFPDPRKFFERIPGDQAKGWPIPERHRGSIPDGADNTFLIAEAGKAVPWTSPQDIQFRFVWTDDYSDEKGAERSGQWETLGGMFDGDFHVMSVSGNAIVFLPKTTPVDKLRPFITIGGGVFSDFEDLKKIPPRK